MEKLKVQTAFRFDAEILDLVKEKANAQRRSLNNYIELLLHKDVGNIPNKETRGAVKEAMDGKCLEEIVDVEEFLDSITMYNLEVATKFKKDLKKIKKRPVDFELPKQVLKILQKQGVAGIPQQMIPHKLSGEFKNSWECHIKLFLFIIWYQIESSNVIRLIRIGSHSELFK